MDARRSLVGLVVCLVVCPAVYPVTGAGIGGCTSGDSTRAGACAELSACCAVMTVPAQQATCNQVVQSGNSGACSQALESFDEAGAC